MTAMRQIGEFMNQLEKTRNGVKNFFKKVKETDYKNLLNNKIAVTFGSILLLGAVVLSVAVISNNIDKSKETIKDDERRTLGQSILVNGDVSGVDREVDTSDYFAVAAMTRESVREEAMYVLQSIIDSPDVLPDTKDEALADLQSLASEMTKEINIETLIKAKGINNVLAVLSGDKCNVIVKSENALRESSVAQIQEIVYLETGIHPKLVKIIDTLHTASDED